MLPGTLFGLAAGLLWGLVFVAPLWLPDYPAALLSVGRYLAFGLIALPLAWLDRRRLALLTRADWIEALKLAAIGNLLYYLCLSAAIQRAGAPLPTMIIGTLPVVITLVAHGQQRRDGVSCEHAVPWRRMAPSCLLILAGIALVNQVEMAREAVAQGGAARTAMASTNPLATYATGAALALGAVACWTWYPIRNARWLRAHPGRSPAAWATAQGVATLPLALAGYAGWWIWTALPGKAAPFEMPFGPTPARYVALMLVIGLFASWLGTLCWNQASQRLPARLSGPLIVFETLAAMTYAWLLRGQMAPLQTWAGAALLIGGIALALRVPEGSLTVGRPDGHG